MAGTINNYSKKVKVSIKINKLNIIIYINKMKKNIKGKWISCLRMEFLLM